MEESMNMDETNETNMNMQIRGCETESDVEEQQPKKKYKLAFKQAAGDRRLYDRKNLQALDRKLKEWYSLTKCPTVALTFFGGKIYCSGPKQFRNFAKNSVVQEVFSSVVLNQSSDENTAAIAEDHSEIELPDDWRDFDVFSKRKLVIALVTNNGTKKFQWKHAVRPVWWPETVPFGDPNNSKPRHSVDQLHSIISMYSSYMTSVSNDASHHDNNIADGTSDNHSGHNVDVSGNGEVCDDDGNDRGSGGVGDGSSKDVQYNDDVINDQEEDGGGKNVTGGNDQEVGNDDGDNEEMGCNDEEVHVAEGNVDFESEDDHDADYSSTSCGQTSAAAGMENVLKTCTTYDVDDIRKILGFLKSVKSWVDFVACVNLVVNKEVRLTPIYQRPIENQETVHVNDVEKSVRRSVPKRVLKNGWEPVKITGDGNCLFRSFSKIITGSEDEHLLFRLAMIVHGCSHENHYRKNIQYLINDDLDLFLHTITEDAILKDFSDRMSDEDKLMHVYREEVMRTATDGRYSGYLQVLILADTLQRRIIQHCTALGMELFNTELTPSDPPLNVPPIRILWCSISDGVPNHIVPLLKCTQELNTFSKSFKRPCGVFCQYEIDLESGQDVKWVQCDSCLLWFHCGCVQFRKERLRKSWNCGCGISDDEISSHQITMSPEDLKASCNDDMLHSFVRGIANGKIKSRRLDYLKKGSVNALRGDGAVVMDNEDTLELLLNDMVDRIMKNKDCWPPDIPRNTRNIFYFKADVLLPEITIWMMCSASAASRFRSEEVFNRFNPFG